ncbi:LPS translocon maturation chaperone LptM [Ferrimonas pelagia]|uniref:Lipoprotein-attachment site-containing protein n=1 Tax=Ferrimonas pelagia TaxID=1177826 RepID=A0ABP9EGP9_9GAMM
MRPIPLLLLFFLGLAGCGQTGPLYLPEAPAENQAEQSQNEQETQKDDSDSE